MEYIPYKGKSKEDLWQYLDELEMLDLDREAHTDAFDVMEEISVDISGLRLMVERYANTASTYVYGYLAAAISHFARVATREIPPNTTILDELTELTFKMLNEVRWITAQPSSLSTLLNTLQMLIWSGKWNNEIVPDNFAEILQRCLKFGWVNEGHVYFIQHGTVGLLRDMFKAGILQSSFNKEQIKWFQDEVRRYQSHLEDNDSLKTITL